MEELVHMSEWWIVSCLLISFPGLLILLGLTLLIATNLAFVTQPRKKVGNYEETHGISTFGCVPILIDSLLSGNNSVLCEKTMSTPDLPACGLNGRGKEAEH